MARKIYTELEAEAALCLWEAMIEAKAEAEKLQDCGVGGGDDLLNAWEDTGTMFMRHEALRLAHVVCETFALIPVDLRDGHSFDWEIVPAILDTFRWSHAGGAHDEPAQIAAVVSEVLSAQRATEDAKRGKAA